MAERLRSRYVFGMLNADPADLALEIRKRVPDTSVVWAMHDHDAGNVHWHFVVRFPMVTDWQWLRDRCMDLDRHSNSQIGRGWQRCVRYLLHLDNPDKPVIPRRNLSYLGIDDDEVAMLLGRPRASLLADIKSAAARDVFGLVDWLVNERGHTPGEVAQMLRCISSVMQYLGPAQLALASPADGLPSSLGNYLAEVDREEDSTLPDDLGALPDDL